MVIAAFSSDIFRYKAVIGRITVSCLDDIHLGSTLHQSEKFSLLALYNQLVSVGGSFSKCFSDVLEFCKRCKSH